MSVNLRYEPQPAVKKVEGQKKENHNALDSMQGLSFLATITSDLGPNLSV